jgi:pimeloyl-ACP methyl ester carboxylesterase
MFTESASQDLQKEMAEIISDFHPLGFRLMARSLADTDRRDFLPKIQLLTLILWDDQDRRAPLIIGEQLRGTIPNSELAILGNAGHLSNMEQPNGFNTQVRRFCLSNRGCRPSI